MKKIITIGRRHGSGGREIGKMVAKILGINYYDKELLSASAKNSNLGREILEGFDEQPMSVFSYLTAASAAAPSLPINHRVFDAVSATIREIAERESCVFIGRCADFVLRDFPDRLSVFIYAPLEDRIARVMETDKVSEVEAKTYIEKRDAERENYYNFYAGGKWLDMNTYDVCLNSSVLGIENSAKLIAEIASER